MDSASPAAGEEPNILLSANLVILIQRPRPFKWHKIIEVSVICNHGKFEKIDWKFAHNVQYLHLYHPRKTDGWRVKWTDTLHYIDLLCYSNTSETLHTTVSHKRNHYHKTDLKFNLPPSCLSSLLYIFYSVYSPPDPSSVYSPPDPSSVYSPPDPSSVYSPPDPSTV